MMRANVDGAVAMVRAAAQAGAQRIVHCSSVAALGQIGDGTPADENTPTNEADFVGIYKRSKYLAERAVLDLARSASLPVVVVNPAAPVGPRDIKPTPTGKMILDAAAGRMPAYIDTGLNIVHVDDVAEGHVLALEKGRIGERYVLGGENMLLKDILALVADVVHRRPPFIRLPEAVVWPAAFLMEKLAQTTGVAPLMTRDHLKMARKKMFYSSAKAKEELGYNPRPVRPAIEDAVAWFRANGMLAK
jgi:dihydroflavonol-4-reductase